MSDTKISEAAVEAALRTMFFFEDAGQTEGDYVDAHEERDALRPAVEAALAAALPHLHPQPAELADSPAGHELAYAVEKAPGNRDGKRDAELDELLAMAMNELNAINTNLPAEPAEQQGVSITADWVLGYLNTDAPEESREAIRNAFTEWNALAATGKQQVGEVQGDGLCLSDNERAVLQQIQDSLPTGAKAVLVLERLLRDSLAARQLGAQETGIDGYQRAFYELASMMGMTAQPISPKEVWETQMRPMLREMISKNQHRPDVPFEAPTQPEGSREEAMVVLERDSSGRPTVWCDPGVVDLVAALNAAGIATVWSCDGHGHRPATVGLKDGRQLLVLESLDALVSISNLWPDINGNRSQPDPIGYANLHDLKDQSTDGVVLRKRSEFFTVPVYAHAPAQGIDLGRQQDAARWRAIAPLLSVEWDEDEQLKRWTWIDFKGDAPAIPSPTRQEYASVDEAVDALISQRDAAPGVGNGD